MTDTKIKSGYEDRTAVVACIDGSTAALSVCDYSAWLSNHMEAPLMLLHVLDEDKYPAKSDMAGNIGSGSREQLLEELAELDQQRSKLALQHGHFMLEEAENRAAASGVKNPIKRQRQRQRQRQRHDDLVGSLQELEDESRAFVLGLRGESSAESRRHIGSQLETVIRSVHKPVLLVPDDFSEPRSAMLAFDVSSTASRSIELLASSGMFKGMPLHLVMVGADTAECREQLRQASETLGGRGMEIHLEIRPGDVEETLPPLQLFRRRYLSYLDFLAV